MESKDIIELVQGLKDVGARRIKVAPDGSVDVEFGDQPVQWQPVPYVYPWTLGPSWWVDPDPPANPLGPTVTWSDQLSSLTHFAPGNADTAEG